jgi:pyruvate oxidase
VVRVDWVRVGPLEALPAGNSVRVEIDDDAIALINRDGALYALDDCCLHMGARLSEGTIEDDAIRCPWHGWTYALATGRRVDRRGSAVATHPVEVRDGWVFVGLPPSD